MRLNAGTEIGLPTRDNGSVFARISWRVAPRAVQADAG